MLNIINQFQKPTTQTESKWLEPNSFKKGDEQTEFTHVLYM